MLYKMHLWGADAPTPARMPIDDAVAEFTAAWGFEPK